MNAQVVELLETAPVQWDTAVSALSPELRYEVGAELSALLERAARLKGYIEGRYLYEEKPHSIGVSNSNALAAKVRKALGYAYPKQDIQF
jgi:hypothetical protein